MVIEVPAFPPTTITTPENAPGDGPLLGTDAVRARSRAATMGYQLVPRLGLVPRWAFGLGQSQLLTAMSPRLSSPSLLHQSFSFPAFWRLYLSSDIPA